MKSLFTILAAGLLASAAAVALSAGAAAQGSSSSGGTSSRGTGAGSPSMTAPGPGTSQRGTVSPGTSSTGTTSRGERSATEPGAAGTDTGTATGRPSQNRAPAPTIVDRGADPEATGRGRGAAGLATLPASEVQTLQSALNRSGIAVAVDGVMGPETRRALLQYQRENGLAATGELDGPTRARLDLGG